MTDVIILMNTLVASICRVKIREVESNSQQLEIVLKHLQVMSRCYVYVDSGVVDDSDLRLDALGSAM